MGGGDLNLKKSWHPQTLRNVEKVWKAEQKHEAERKKIEELQRELHEERAREEMQRYAEDVGAVKKREEEKKREVLNNPVKMKKIKELLQSSLEKKKRKKKEKKKHKKHRRHNSSGSEDEQIKTKSQEKVEHLHTKKTGYGLQVRDSGHERMLSHKLQQSFGSESQSHSPEKHGGKKTTNQESSRHKRSRSPRDSKQHNGMEQKTKTECRNFRKEQDYRRTQASSRKLSAEELEKRRKEMMENAKWREEERKNNVNKHKKEEEREQALEKLRHCNGKFIYNIKLESASTSSLEDRVKRNIHSIQRTPAALEKNFMRR
ncbi:pre-mRNA-splicing factor CWC25 homolog isoform X3 [Python bivittatus]|uniref:Pre-mRNA-splicing factor CWC25 homolog isoform X3 n=1 Tax=Python bivittatus TaxID=176946 RepID=A0A9F5N0I4_PYTBI|nr:pre-mRNA-splicing factor CWC25 homolog isoform X3 [Python bivittatus]